MRSQQNLESTYAEQITLLRYRQASVSPPITSIGFTIISIIQTYPKFIEQFKPSGGRYSN